MHVLMISDVYFPRINGVSTSIRTYRADLERLGCRTSLVAPQYDAPWRDDVSTVRVPSGRVPFDHEDRLMSPLAMRRVLAGMGGGFDLVHIQTPFVAHWAGVRLARRLGLPIVETYHTFFEEYLHHYIPLLPEGLLRHAARRFSRRQCNAVDAIVAPSRAMADILRDYGVGRPIHVIPTGLRIADFERGAGERFRLQHRISRERPVLLHVGRVALEKNIDFIFDVVTQVRGAVPDVLLVIAGEGPALDGLRRRAAAEGLSENILFVGYLNREEELLDCYKSANAFVFASATETQGLVLLEALASGLPVVSTAVLGTRDILEAGAGAVVVRGNIDEFAEAVVAVLRDPALQRSLGEQGRSYAKQWSNEATAKRMFGLYAGLLE